MKSHLPRVHSGDARFNSDGLDRVLRVLESEIQRGTMPGAVIMVGRSGRVVQHEALGVQDPVTGTPMQSDSLFRIFSMTKPIVSVATMMLVEEGSLCIDEPLSKFVPAFSRVKVGQIEGMETKLVDPVREITIHDLLRHTSGLSHEIMETHVQAKYATAQLARRDRSNEEHAERIAELPLLCHPGAEWNYSRSVEVLGRVIEVVSGKSLGEVLHSRLLEPLGMTDTGFFLSADQARRAAQPFSRDPWSGDPVALFDVAEVPRFEAGGGGLLSSAPDFARFAQMLLDEGTFAGHRYLGSRTVRFMTANHLNASIPQPPAPLPAGYGFGLGFAVRTDAGLAPFPGSVGSYFWNGAAGTQFWVDPAEQMWALLMVQAPRQREHLRVLIRNLVYAALDS